MKEKLHVAVVQTSAGKDLEKNLSEIESMISEVPLADLIVLPEVFALRSDDEDYRSVAEAIPGALTHRISFAARDSKSWILAGSMIERDGEQIFNTSVLFDPEGHIKASYRKIHLFAIDDKDGPVVDETEVFSAGEEPTLTDIEGWQCGLSVCYDLRFPELYRQYSEEGAHILFVPANFTSKTGEAHWKTLLRARAIENQCFVVAPNQCGTNESTGVASYGHSMIVDPWGEVLAEAEEEPLFIMAELDAGVLEEVRAKLPVLEHRRFTKKGD